MMRNRRYAWFAGVLAVAWCAAVFGQAAHGQGGDPQSKPKKAVTKAPPGAIDEGGEGAVPPAAPGPTAGTGGFGAQPPAGVGPMGTNPGGGPTSPPMMGAGSAPAARPPAKKVGEMKLEELILNAVQHHADILAAQSKVREAEMELIRTRQKVLSDIVVKQADYEAARAIFAEVEQRHAQVKQLYAQKFISDEEASKARLAMLSAKADLTRAEAALGSATAVAPPGMAGMTMSGSYAPLHSYTPYPMIGSGMAPSSQWTPTVGGTTSKPGGMSSPSMGSATPVGSAAPTSALGKLIKKLATKVRLDANDQHLTNVLDKCRAQTELTFILDDSLVDLAAKLDVPRDVTLGAAIQWIEDAFQCRCVVREYGIVVTKQERLPPGAIFVSDLWRNSDQSLLGGEPGRPNDPLRPATSPKKQ